MALSHVVSEIFNVEIDAYMYLCRAVKTAEVVGVRSETNITTTTTTTTIGVTWQRR